MNKFNGVMKKVKEDNIITYMKWKYNSNFYFSSLATLIFYIFFPCSCLLTRLYFSHLSDFILLFQLVLFLFYLFI